MVITNFLGNVKDSNIYSRRASHSYRTCSDTSLQDPGLSLNLTGPLAMMLNSRCPMEMNPLS